MKGLWLPPGEWGKGGIFLITDYGDEDWFAGILKARIFELTGHHPIDITHQIPPGDIQKAGFAIWATVRDIPPFSILVVVVDPDVGSQRKICVWQVDERLIISPEGNFLSFVHGFKVHVKKEVLIRGWSIDISRYVKGLIGQTFHGRDVFAPLCRDIIQGEVPPATQEELPPPYQFLTLSYLKTIKKHEITVTYVDRFGNLFTNVFADFLPDYNEKCVRITDGSRTFYGIYKTYSKIDERAGITINGYGLLEIAGYRVSASDLYGLRPGDVLTAEWILPKA